MRFAILAPGPHKILLEQTYQFAHAAFESARASDQTGQIDQGLWQEFWRSGLAVAPFPLKSGGAGLSEPENQGALCAILRTLGGADLSIARLFEGHVNAISLVMRYGTSHHVERLAKDVEGGMFCGVWGAEDSEGLKLRPHGRDKEMSGRKVFASGADFVKRPLVTVASPEGPLLFLLNAPLNQRANVSDWKPLGMRASSSGSVNLTGISVSCDDQIGAPGDYHRQPFFSAGAWRFCAAQLGAIDRLTSIYREQLISRGRAEDPYQLERLAQCGAAAGSAQFWVEEASRRFADDSLGPESVVAFVNLTRMVTERAALDVVERVQRGLGLSAFIQPHPVERICRDLATYLRQPVPDLAMSDAARAIIQGKLTIGGV